MNDLKAFMVGMMLVNDPFYIIDKIGDLGLDRLVKYWKDNTKDWPYWGGVS